MCIRVSLVSNFTATKVLSNSGYPDAETSTSSRPPKWKLMRNIGIQNCLLQPEPDMKKETSSAIPTKTYTGIQNCFLLSIQNIFHDRSMSFSGVLHEMAACHQNEPRPIPPFLFNYRISILLAKLQQTSCIAHALNAEIK
jgi:hypothetical protein